MRLALSFLFCAVAAFAQVTGPVAQAQLLVAQGKYDEAVKIYDEAIRKDPTFSAFHLNRGLIRLKQKKWKDALADCTTAQQLSRPSVETYYCRGAAYANLNKHELAKDSLNRALAIRPDHQAALEAMSALGQKTKGRDQALDALTEQIAQAPQKASNYFERGRLHEKNGNMYAAIEDYSAAVRYEPKESYMIARAEAFTKIGDFNKAIAAYTEMLRRMPNSPPLLAGRGKALLLRGDENAANADFNAARSNPSYAHIVRQYQASAPSMKRRIAETKATADALLAAANAPVVQPAATVASLAPGPGGELAPIVEDTAARTLVLTRNKAPQQSTPARSEPAPAETPVQQPPTVELKRAETQVAATAPQSAPPQATPAPAPQSIEVAKSTPPTAPGQPTPAETAKSTAPPPVQTRAPQPAETAKATPPAQAPAIMAPTPAPQPVVETAKATPPTQVPAITPPAPAPSPAASADATSDAIRRHLEEAGQHVRAKQVDQAISAYSQAIALKADMPATWVDRAKLYAQSNQIDKAIADYSESLKLKPEQPEVWGLLCAARVKANDAKAAIADCEKAVQLKPKSVDFVLARAQAYVAARQFDKAAIDFETVLAAKTDMPETHVQLGQIYLELEQHVLALHHFTVALQQKPGFKEAFKMRAIVKEALGDTLGRDADMKKANS